MWFEAALSDLMPGNKEGIEGYRKEYIFIEKFEKNLNSRNILASA